MKAGLLPTGCQVHDRTSGNVQCARSLNDEECLLLDDYLARQPDAWLRVFKKVDSSWDFDLGFLARLPSLRHLDIDADAGDLNDLSPLGLVTDRLRSLSLDTVSAFSDKKLDRVKDNVQVLGRFGQLEKLQVCGQIRDLGFLSSVKRIRTLSLWRTKLKSLEGIQAAANLETLTINWNGSLSLEPIGQLQALKAMEFSDSRNLRGIEHAGTIASLQRAWFLSCGKEFRVFDPTHLANLRVAVMHSSTGPGNIETLSRAPNLRCLVLSNTPEKLTYADFEPLFNHSTLREVRADNVESGVLDALSRDQGWKVSPYPNFPADEYLAN
ncbi:hypothetical protein [Arenimonas sp.]|uniref:hypothetical protein n=1 Tax=Arenimonas sp. TaxID=1872635 RepID=UPI0035AFF2BC